MHECQNNKKVKRKQEYKNEECNLRSQADMQVCCK